MFTNVMVHEFCRTLATANKLKNFVGKGETLDALKLAREFMWQHALEEHSRLLPAAITTVQDWFNKWEGKQKFLTNIKNKHESQSNKGAKGKADG